MGFGVGLVCWRPGIGERKVNEFGLVDSGMGFRGGARAVHPGARNSYAGQQAI